MPGGQETCVEGACEGERRGWRVGESGTKTGGDHCPVTIFNLCDRRGLARSSVCIETNRRAESYPSRLLVRESR